MQFDKEMRAYFQSVNLLNTKCKHTFRLMGPDEVATGLKKDSNL